MNSARSWGKQAELRPSQPATALAFAADGSLLASGGGPNHEVLLWHIPEGHIFKTLSGHTGRVWAIASSSDGQWLATGATDKSVRLWRMPEGKLSHLLIEHEKSVEALCFSPTDTVLASGGNDGTIRLWDCQTGHQLRVLKVPQNGSVLSLTFSPQGHLLASGHLDKTVRLWNVTDGRLLHQWEVRVGWLTPMGVGWSRSVIFLDDRALLSGHDQKQFNFWDIHSMQHIRTLQDMGATQTLALSPDKKLVAQITSHNRVFLWDTSSWQKVELTPKHVTVLLSNGRDTVTFSPDGKWLASAGRAAEIFL